MEVMYILIGFSLAAALGFLVAFIWALRRGQFDDLVTPSMRMLFESDRKKESSKNNGSRS
jgi:cbb3-type cytochrome oxidase maturation protein